MSKVLVVAVHPDDETLGCGGTLFKHKDVGDEIYWLIVTSANETLGYSKDFIENRNEQIKKVASIYGFTEIIKLDIPTTKVDLQPFGELINNFSEIIHRIQPEIIYVPYYGDAHSDHQVIFKVLTSCFKSFRYPSIKKILMMETLSETENAFPIESRIFKPNYYVNITGFINDKIKAMKIYESEIMKSPFPRSEKVIRALSTYRGSFIAENYAEAFMIVKEVW